MIDINELTEKLAFECFDANDKGTYFATCAAIQAEVQRGKKINIQVVKFFYFFNKWNYHAGFRNSTS